MAKLKKIFIKGVETIFKVFEEAVVIGTYNHVVSDDGFETPGENNIDMEAIIDSFEQKDLNSLSFADQIQPTDLKCLLPGKFLGETIPDTQDTIYIEKRKTGESVDETYSVVAFDTDPYKVLYTILLRNA